MSKKTVEELEIIRDRNSGEGKNWIKVGMSTCGIAAGADEVYKTLVEEAKKRNIEVTVKKCGCAGKCYAEPLVEVNVEGAPRVTYGKVTKEVALSILEKHVRNKKLVNDYIFI
ncbi:MAG: (2Fe-2S) ferredoxin domain-containing protein [Candidatus Firestonebacteria bacterium]